MNRSHIISKKEREKSEKERKESEDEKFLIAFLS
jgi:hypothetical protein